MAVSGTIGTAAVAIVPTTEGFDSRAVDQVSASLSGLVKKGLGIAGLTLAFGEFEHVLAGSFEAGRDAARTGRLLDEALKNTGATAGVTKKSLDDLATSQSNKIAVDDDTIKSAEQMILRFRGVRNEVGAGNDIFNQAVVAAGNLAPVFGTTVPQAALKLGRALNDPTRALTLLTRSGVAFTQQQRDQIKAFVETGNLLGAQKVILDNIAKSFAGAGAAAADPIQRLHVLGQNLEEQVGQGLLPVASKFVDVVDQVAPEIIDKLLPSVLSLADSFASLAESAAPAIEGLGQASATSLGVLADVVGGLASALDAIPGPVLEVLATFGAFVLIGSKVAKGIGLAADAVELLAVRAAIAIPALEGMGEAAITAGEAVDTGMAAALGPIGLIAIGILAVVTTFTLFKHTSDEASRKAKETGDALLALSESASAGASSVLDLNKAFTDAIDNGKLGDLGKKLSADNNALLESFARTGFGVEQFANDLSHGAAGVRDFAATAARATHVPRDLAAELKAAGLSQRDLTDALAAGGKRADDALSALDSYGQSTKGNFFATAAWANSLRDLVDAFRDAQTAEFAQARGQLALLDSTGKLSTAERDNLDHGRNLIATYIEAKQRIDDQTQAQAAAIERQNEAGFSWQSLADAVVAAGGSYANLPKMDGADKIDPKAISAFAKQVSDALASITSSVQANLPSTSDVIKSWRDEVTKDYGDVASAGKDLQKAQESLDSAQSSAGASAANAAARDAAAAANAADASAARIERARLRLEHAQEAAASATGDAHKRALRTVQSAQLAFDQAVAGSSKHSAGAIVSANNSVVDALKTKNSAAAALKAAQDALVKAVDPQHLIDNLNKTRDNIDNFNKNVATLFSSGNERAAQEALKLGPEIGGAYAAALNAAGPKVTAGANNALIGVDAANQRVLDNVNNVWGPQIVKDFGAISQDASGTFNFGIGGPPSQKALDDNLANVAFRFGFKSKEFHDAAAALGLTTTQGYHEVLGLADATKQSLQDAIDAVNSPVFKTGFDNGFHDLFGGTPEDAATAFDGSGVAKSIVDGVVQGLADHQVEIDQQVDFMFTAAANKARHALGISSPSKVFATIGGQVIDGFTAGINASLPRVDAVMRAASHRAATTFAAQADKDGGFIDPSRFIRDDSNRPTDPFLRHAKPGSGPGSGAGHNPATHPDSGSGGGGSGGSSGGSGSSTRTRSSSEPDITLVRIVAPSIQNSVRDGVIAALTHRDVRPPGGGPMVGRDLIVNGKSDPFETAAAVADRMRAEAFLAGR